WARKLHVRADLGVAGGRRRERIRQEIDGGNRRRIVREAADQPMERSRGVHAGAHEHEALACDVEPAAGLELAVDTIPPPCSAGSGKSPDRIRSASERAV